MSIKINPANNVIQMLRYLCKIGENDTCVTNDDLFVSYLPIALNAYNLSLDKEIDDLLKYLQGRTICLFGLFGICEGCANCNNLLKDERIGATWKKHLKLNNAYFGQSIERISIKSEELHYRQHPSPREVNNEKQHCPSKNSCTKRNCELIHPDQIDCQYGNHCKFNGCGFKHPDMNLNPSKLQTKPPTQGNMECRFKINCNNPDCKFLHPAQLDCKYGKTCGRSECAYKHPKEHFDLHDRQNRSQSNHHNDFHGHHDRSHQVQSGAEQRRQQDFHGQREQRLQDFHEQKQQRQPDFHEQREQRRPDSHEPRHQQPDFQVSDDKFYDEKSRQMPLPFGNTNQRRSNPVRNDTTKEKKNDISQNKKQ